MPPLRDKVRGIYEDTSACTGSSVENAKGVQIYCPLVGPLSMHASLPRTIGLILTSL